MFICVLLASGSFSFLGTPNHMVQPRNGHWYSAVSSSTRSHQRGGWRNGYTLEVRATTQLRIRTSTCSRSCAAQWGSVAFGGGRGLGRGGGAKGEERGCGGRQAYREPIDFYRRGAIGGVSDCVWAVCIQVVVHGPDGATTHRALLKGVLALLCERLSQSPALSTGTAVWAA